MKFVHAADLHLDSPLRGLVRYEGAPVDRIRLATRQAFQNLIQLCLDEDVQLLLLAGDIFDGSWRDYATGLFFVNELKRLRETHTQVVLLHGNHDAASPLTRDLELPSHVHLLSERGPETVEFDGLAVHGQSFPKREVFHDLAALYPDPIPSVLNVGMLHTALTGRPDHAPYAPTRLEVLRDRGYEYWALGHVHTREVLCEEPYVVFPGNLQGRHIRETGPKGATLVGHAGGDVLSAEHRNLDVVRWERVTVELEADDDAERTLGRIEQAVTRCWDDVEGRLLAVRVDLVGSCAAHHHLETDHALFEHNVRLRCSDIGDVWVEKIVVRSNPTVDVPRLLEQESSVGAVLRSLERAKGDRETQQALANELRELEKKLPREAREGVDGIDLENPAYLEQVLDEVAATLLPGILPDSGSANGVLPDSRDT